MTAPDEAQALERLREAADALLAGVEGAVPAWARREVGRVVSAWGALDSATVDRTLAAAEEAGATAARRVRAELAALFALDPADQAATPLEIVRGAVAEPTAVLEAAGIPEVVRDEFESRAWPGDRYALVPRSFQDLDEDLAAVHFAWGVAKAEVLRARRARGPGRPRGARGPRCPRGESPGSPPR